MGANIDLQAMTQQGPVFWLASGAIALGLSMIVAALVQARRLRAPVQRTETGIPAPIPAAPDNPQPARKPGREAMVSDRVEPRRERDPSTTLRLERLLGRLDRVSAQLDRVESPVPEPEAAVESDLKEASSGVEYVFRATGG